MTCLGSFDHLLDDKPFELKDWQGELVLSSSDYVAQYILPVIVAGVCRSAEYQFSVSFVAAKLPLKL